MSGGKLLRIGLSKSLRIGTLPGLQSYLRFGKVGLGWVGGSSHTEPEALGALGFLVQWPRQLKGTRRTERMQLVASTPNEGSMVDPVSRSPLLAANISSKV